MNDFETKQLLSLSNKVEVIEGKVDDLSKSVYEILFILKGGDSKTQPGMIELIDDHEERIEAIEQLKTKGASMLIGAAAVGTAGGILSSKFLEFFKRLLS